MNNRSQSSNTTYHQNLRAEAANVIYQVIEQKQSLNVALADIFKKINEKDRALIQEICFGIMRFLPELEFYIENLMDKTLTGKNRIIHYLIVVGLYQIIYTRIPQHAAMNETVNGAVSLKKHRLKGVVNGVLRSFLRQQDELKQKFIKNGNISLHPDWLITRIKQAYPKHWQQIIEENNQKPPMWLRVNKLHYSVKEYQSLLQHSEVESESSTELADALRLHSPIAVNKLPEFSHGAVTIQDLSAQHAAHLLEPRNGESVLDLCAAPGGKTTHILELAPKANVLAVDIDSERIKRILENLSRLKLNAEVKIGDGLTPEKWCFEKQFDKILLDAPCSATGIIRRHPDIKWLRRESDIEALVQLQYSILTKIWSYLKPDGVLVYATCSILPQENDHQISRFLENHNNADLVKKTIQYLPTKNGGDGFFYAKLKKLLN